VFFFCQVGAAADFVVELRTAAEMAVAHWIFLGAVR